MINYDVPSVRVPGTSNNERPEYQADPETYLHRIGRTGRFAAQGIAVTIYDREIDEKYLDDILKHYDMQQMIKTLEGPDHLKDVLKQIQE